MKLQGKTAVITGASDGIGKEVALRLAEEKVSLALIGRSEQRLRRAVEQTKKLGSPKSFAYTCDLTDNQALRKIVQEISSDFGKVNILINIAGVWQKLNYLEDILEEEIEGVINTNLTALVQITRLLIPRLREADEAAIINFASRSGVTAQPGQAVYCASKWGVTGLTEVLKLDLEDTNIRVAGIYTGGVKTKLLEKAGDKISDKDYTDPSDVADLIAYILTRPENMWIHDVRVEY